MPCYFCNFVADYAASVYTEEGIATEGWIPQYWVAAHVCKTCLREDPDLTGRILDAVPLN